MAVPALQWQPNNFWQMDNTGTDASAFLLFDGDKAHKCMNPTPYFFFVTDHEYLTCFAEVTRKNFLL
jgi:hypothetical protein